MTVPVGPRHTATPRPTPMMDGFTSPGRPPPVQTSAHQLADGDEVYCKLLAHNVCVLIQPQCALGIEPVFWEDGEAPDEPHGVLPLVRPG